MSQTFAAAGIAQLAADGAVKYEERISSVLPWAESGDPAVAKDATVADLLGHRIGLQAVNSFIECYQGNFRHEYDEKKVAQIFKSLKSQADLRSQFVFNNIGYALLGYVIAERSPTPTVTQRCCRYLRENPYEHHLLCRTLAPLRMRETRCNYFWFWHSGAYAVLDNGLPYRVDRTTLEGKWYYEVVPENAVGYMQSSANDLAKYCTALNTAWKAQREGRKVSPASSVFPDVNLLFDPLVPLDGKDANKSFASGWAVCRLPAKMGDLGINPELIEMPVVGVGLATPTTVIWSQGRFPLAGCFVALLPEYESSVIVLNNTATANDAADWIGQLLIQTLLGNPYRNNYCFLASVSADRAHQRYAELAEKIEEGRQSGGPRRSYSQYKGCYECTGRPDMVISMYSFLGPLKRKLKLEINYTEYQLRHHHDDTFTWFMSWNEHIKNNRTVQYFPEYYFLRFNPNEDGSDIVSLTWVHNPAFPEGDVFTWRYK